MAKICSKDRKQCIALNALTKIIIGIGNEGRRVLKPSFFKIKVHIR